MAENNGENPKGLFKSGQFSRREFLKKAALLGLSTSVASACVPVVTPPPEPAATPAPTEAPPVVEKVECPGEYVLELRKEDFTCANIDWRKFEGSELTVAYWEAQWLDADRISAQFFEELTGIHINFESFPELEIHDKIFVDLSSGAGQFDTFDMEFMLIPQYAEANYLEPLDKYFNDPNLTDKEWYDQGDYFQSIWEGGLYKEELFAVVPFVETIVLTYRTDHFTKEPDTFEDLWEQAEQATKAPDIYGFTTRGERGQGMNVYTWTTFLKGFGGDFFADFPNDMHPVVNSEEAVEATKFYAELLQNYGPPGQAAFTWAETTQAFTEGKAASILEFSANPAVLDTPDSPWSGKCNYTMTPRGPAGRFASFWSFVNSINPASKNKEAAWLYLLYKTSKPHAVFFTTGGAPTPVRASTSESEAYLESLVSQVTFPERWLEVSNESFAKGYASPSYRPLFPHWREMGDRLGVAVSAAIAGEGTAKEVLDSAQKDIEVMLQENGYI